MTPRLLTFALGWLLAASAVAAQHWEHIPHSKQGISYNQYLASLNIPAAGHRSQCKDDRCRYWISIGNAEFRVSKDAAIVSQSRYDGATWAIYHDDEDYYLLSASRSGRGKRHGKVSREIAACLATAVSQSIISVSGTPVCLSGNTLYLGSEKKRLSGNPVASSFGTSYSGYWALAYADEKMQVHVGNHKGFTPVLTSLHERSDIDQVLSVFPTSQNSQWLAVYEYMNKRNKSLRLYRIKGDSVSDYTVANTVEDDRGVRPMVYQSLDGELHVSSDALTGNYFYDFQPSSLHDQQPHYNPFQSVDVADITASVGLRLTRWHVNQSTKEPSNGDGDSKSLSSTEYEMNDSMLTEYRFAGRFMRTQLALSYLKNESERDMNSLQKTASHKLWGALGIDGLFKGPAVLRLEFASEKAGGIATYEDANDQQQVVAFENDYHRYSAMVTQELGWFMGGSYVRNNMPMAIAFYEAGLSDPLLYFDPDFSLQKLLFVIGYDTSQYASRYLFSYRDFYIDGRFGIGLYQYDIGRDVVRDAEQVSGKSHSSDIGLALDGALEAGYLWQVRSVDAGGLGVSFQTGISVDIETYLNGVSEDTEVDDDEIVSSFERTDIRWGPYLRLNLLF